MGIKRLMDTRDPYPSLNNCLIGGMGLLCAGFVLWGEKKMPFTIVAGFLVLVAVLYFASPYRIDRHVVTFEIIVWSGLLIEIPIEFFWTNIPAWITWSWLIAAILICVIFPFPIKTSQYH